MLGLAQIKSILGKDAENLLSHRTTTIPKEDLHWPSVQTIEDVFSQSDRSEQVIDALLRMYNHGRLAETGYLSILPVDQAIEHSAGSAFGKNPMYFDPEAIMSLAIKGGCSAVATTVGVLGMVSKSYADKIPFIAKINHNDLFVYPNKHDQIMFSSVEHADNLGAVGVGATIYFGSQESGRQIQEISQAFEEAHKRGMFTVLWCYVRNEAFTVGGKNYESAADFTAQANHIGATLGADIIKQKSPTLNGGYKALNTDGSSFGKYSEEMYNTLTTDHPIDLTRYQVAHCYMGRIPLINSGGASTDNDMHDAVRSAVINKRAGGSGLIMGRKAFQKPFKEGVEMLHAVQDVYLNKDITIA